jgi:DmX-like protein
VACGHEIVVFRVSESQAISSDSNHLINLRMERLYTISNESLVDTLAWEPKDGRYLLAGGTRLVLWEFRHGFANRVSKASASSEDRRLIEEQLHKLFGEAPFRIAATLQTDDPERSITHLAFSPDGAMFASTGLHDRCIKVWFHNSLTGFTFVYLPHARAVSDFEWRLPYTNQYA